MKKKIILSNGNELIYEFTPKKIKNINIRISPDGSVKVSSPHSMPISRVEAFILQKQDFILRAVDNAVKTSSATRCLGDVIHIFGTPYPVVRINSDKNRMVLSDNKLYVFSDGNAEVEKKLKEKFILKTAKSTLTELVKKTYPLFSGYKIAYPDLKFRIMTTRWGTCHTVKNIITLNANLIFYPVACAEYVICHELAHLIVADHSKRFYSVLGAVMPDYKARKSILKNYYREKYI